MLGKLAGCIILAIASVRYFAAIHTRDEHIRDLFIFIAILTVPFTYIAWYSLIPGIAAVLITFFVFQENMKFMRQAFILEAMLWLTYSVAVGSYSGTITDIH